MCLVSPNFRIPKLEIAKLRKNLVHLLAQLGAHQTQAYEVIAGYLAAAAEDPNPEVFLAALDTVAKDAGADRDRS